MPTSQPLTTGYYYIVNDQWENYVALCDWDRHDNHLVKAEADDDSDNAKWHVTQQRNKKYILRNVGRQLYAVVEPRSQEHAPVQGKSHDQDQQWKLTEQREPGKYIIQKTDTWLVWSLPDGERKTVVELTKNTNDRRAWWRFVSADPDYVLENSDHTPAGRSTLRFSGDDIRTSPQQSPPSWLPVTDLSPLSAPDLIETLKSVMVQKGMLTRRHTDTLRKLLSTSAGRQSIIDVSDAANTLYRVYEYLISLALSPGKVLEDEDSRPHVFVALGAAFAVFPSLPKGFVRKPNSKLRPLLSDVSKADRDKVLNVFGYAPLFTLSGHAIGSFVLSVAYSPDGKSIASGSLDETIRLWDAETGEPVGEPLRGYKSSVWSVAFSPDGQRLVSGSGEKMVQIWSLETRPAMAATLTGHENRVNSVAFSPDGRSIVSGSSDTTVRVWDAETGCAVGYPLRGHTHWVLSVAFSRDGTRIVSASSGNTIHVWNATTHEVIKVLEGHTNGVASVVFSPDGARLVSGSWDNTIRIWDAETGETALGPLHGHTNWINSVAISPNGLYIASSSNDQTVRLWDAATGQAVGEPLRGHQQPVYSVAFSPDSQRIVSGSYDDTLMIWEVNSE